MGVGQGNKNGMIEVLKKRGHCVNLRSSLSLLIISVVCFAFVDNTDLPISDPTRNTTEEELQDLFQAELDCWSGLLQVTGGELDPKNLGAILLILNSMDANGITELSKIWKAHTR